MKALVTLAFASVLAASAAVGVMIYKGVAHPKVPPSVETEAEAAGAPELALADPPVARAVPRFDREERASPPAAAPQDVSELYLRALATSGGSGSDKWNRAAHAAIQGLNEAMKNKKKDISFRDVTCFDAGCAVDVVFANPAAAKADDFVWTDAVYGYPGPKALLPPLPERATRKLIFYNPESNLIAALPEEPAP
jgi:hypothetical protein